MRYLLIQMSGAALGRLKLLRDSDQLPLPIAQDTMRPFGFRFADEVMCVTYKGRDVAFVPKTLNDEKTGFLLSTTLPQSETIDTALRTAFGNVRRALDQNGRFLAQQQKDEKAALLAERLEREASNEARHAEMLEKTARFLTDKRPTSFEIGITPEEVMRDPGGLRSEFSRGADLVSVTAWGLGYQCTIIANIHPIGSGEGVRITVNEQNRLHITDGQEQRDGLYVDPEALTAEIRRQITRRDTLKTPETTMRVIDALRALPAPTYALQPFRLNNFENLHPSGSGTAVHVRDGVYLYLEGHSLAVQIQGVNILRFDMSASPKFFETPQDGFKLLLHYSLVQSAFRQFDADICHRLGSAWMEALAAAHSKMDLTPYALTDAQDLEEEAASMDAGYAL